MRIAGPLHPTRCRKEAPGPSFMGLSGEERSSRISSTPPGPIAVLGCGPRASSGPSKPEPSPAVAPRVSECSI